MKKIKTVLYEILYFVQKIFRKNHLSDKEIWDCGFYLAKFILPRLIAFRSQKFHGYPDDVNSIVRSRTIASEENEREKIELENSPWQWVKMMQAVLSFKCNRIF
jgi:hypothetical protein